MRPINETPADLARERAVADFLEARWRCQMVKLPPTSYPADYGAYRAPERHIPGIKSTLCAIVEIKCRSRLIWPLMLSLQKASRLSHYATTMNIPAFIVFSINSEIWSHQVSPPYPTGMGGREDRNQTGDMEPVILIEAADKIGVLCPTGVDKPVTVAR